MKTKNECKEHPKMEVSLICKEESCKKQPICTKCVSKHRGHDLIDIQEFWEGRISEMQNNPVELAIPNKLRILKQNIQGNISHIEISNQMKKEIMSWGEQMKREANTQIQSTVQGLLKQLEGGIGNIYIGIYIGIYIYIYIGIGIGIGGGIEGILKQTSSLHILNDILGDRRDHIMALKEKLNNRSYDIIGELYIETEEELISLIDYMKVIQEVHLDMKGQIVQEIVKQQNLQLKKNINRKLKVGADNLLNQFHNLYPKEKEIDQIVSASLDKSIIFWNADGSPNHIHKGEKQYFRLLELRTGNIAAASGRNLEIIDRKEGHVLSTLQGHENSIRCIEELSSGELVTGSQDSTIRIWDLKNNIPLRVLKQHTDWVFCVKEHSSGQLLSGSKDHSVCVWNPKNGHLLSQHNNYNNETYIFNFEELPNNQILSVCTDESKELGLRIWGLENGETLINIPPVKEAPFGFMTSCMLSGGRIVLGENNADRGNIVIFDVESAQFIQTHSVHEGSIWQIVKGKEGQIITCSSDKSLKLINVHTGEVIVKYLKHQDMVFSVLVLFKE